MVLPYVVEYAFGEKLEVTRPDGEIWMGLIGRIPRENVGTALAAGAIRTDEIRIGEPPPRTWAPATEQSRIVASAAATKWTVLVMIDYLLYTKMPESPIWLQKRLESYVLNPSLHTSGGLCYNHPAADGAAHSRGTVQEQRGGRRRDLWKAPRNRATSWLAPETKSSSRASSIP